MNVPALEMQEFLAEYGSLAFPGRRLLRVDHFCRRDDQKWQTVFILEQEGSQLLTDAEGQVLGQYERITPLFVAEPVNISREVQDLLEQLSGLRSRFSREKYGAAQKALENLSGPSLPFAPVYQVEHAGLLGIVDPMGQVIVPAEYAQITPLALTQPGDASLFLCRRGGHRLNSLDVFDGNGNCIFREIGNLYPREETRLTSANAAEPVESVKSLWVSHQTLDHPFPEDPDFQLVQEEAHPYKVKELRHPIFCGIQLMAMEDTLWRYCPVEEMPPRDVLSPMAATVGAAIGCSSQEVLSRLADFRAFRQERTPLSVRLANVTDHTPLDRLGFSVRAHHCLLRSGLQNAGEVMALSEEALSRLRRSTDEIIQEIRVFRGALSEILNPTS